MSHLSPSALSSARAWLDAHGRPLDQALVRHLLDGGPREAVAVELAAFQNEDGGFGRALEPDLRCGASTAIASYTATGLMLRIGLPTTHPLVSSTLAYLERTLDRERGVWPIIGPEVESAPHAFWWGWSEQLAAQWNGFRFNPTAELLAFLHTHAAAVDADLLASVNATFQQSLADQGTLEGAYDVRCCVALFESGPDHLRTALEPILIRSIEGLLSDPHADLASLIGTGSALYPHFRAAVDAARARAAEAQQADGSWRPFWDWSAVDADAWAAAERDWRSVLTRQQLLSHCAA